MGYEELEEQRDSRECIESDLLALTKKWHDYDGDFMKIYSSVAYAQIKELLDRQAVLTERETSHDNPYVGLVRGKQWERTEMSDYYCGRCGWKVTDHDSYCPECGGALHRAANKPDGKFDAPKTADTPETDTSKGDIRDFDDTCEKQQAELDKCGETYFGATIEEWYELAVRMEAERDVLRAELDEYDQTHVALPVDADGVPIHMGDYLSSDEYNGERFVCMGLDVEVRGESEHWSVGKRLDADTGCVEYTAAHRCHHVKPRTVEDVLSEFRFKASCIYDDPNIGGEDRADALESLDEEYAAEIRELMEVER